MSLTNNKFNIIRNFKESYSHVDSVLQLKDSDGYNFVLGSIPNGGVAYRKQDPNSEYILYKCDCRKINKLENNRVAFLEAIEQYVGASYDWSALIGFIIPNRDWENSNKWFCSELKAKGLKEIGVDIRKNVSRISPMDLLRTGLFELIK